MNYDEALIVLGLTPDNCTVSVLKKAYARAAKIHRPETNPEQFTQIRLAYERIKEALTAIDNTDLIELTEETAIHHLDNQTDQPLSLLIQAIVKYEQLDINSLSNDPIIKQHQLDILALDIAWKVFVPEFLSTEHLPETQRPISQVACLNTIFKEPALSHYLTRQIFAERLGWFLLEPSNTWISLDAFKLVLKTFDYESYGWHNQSWTQHSLLETQCDELREKNIFQLNAKQARTVEYYLVYPMGFWSFVKLWFIHRRQAKALKLRLIGIHKKYPKWSDLLNKQQVWRIENWPNTSIQMLCMLLGLFTTPVLLWIIKYILFQLYTWIHYINNHIMTIPTVLNTIHNLSKPDNYVSMFTEVLMVLGSVLLSSIIYMVIYSYTHYYINLHYKNFTQSINIDNINSIDGNKGDTDNNSQTSIPLSTAQTVYKTLNNTLTLSFFGNIEAILILIILFFWPWQHAQFFSLESKNNYVLISMLVGILSFIYLRYLSKRQRIVPNHPYICAGAVCLAVYLLSAPLNNKQSVTTTLSLIKKDDPSRWMVLILTALMIRTQFPSFLRIDWSQVIPSWLLFNRFRVLEKTAVHLLSAISILLLLVAIISNNLFTHPIIASILCIVLYIWLIINADMDTPVMDIRARIITATAVILSIAIKLSVAISNITTLEWMLSVSILVSMAWYWIYGYSQNYFERWTVKDILNIS